DEWLAPAPGTDGALAMAMGHVVLKEFFVDRDVEYFRDYVTKYTDLPFLVTLDRDGESYKPGKMLTAAQLPGALKDTENAAFKTVLLDSNGMPCVPNGSLGHRYGEVKGQWNLDLGELKPLLSAAGTDEPAVLVDLPRFDTASGEAATMRRGIPVRRIGDHLVTTVYDLLLAQYGVGRPGLPGTWPTG
ncbi:molybdopterin-dependent oxidoreductase, partial [Actinoplanes sp. KI2]